LSNRAGRRPAETLPARPRPTRSITGQRARVLQLLRERLAGFSSVQAIEFGILRLPNKISEPRRQGFQIAGRPAASGVMTYFLLAEPKSVLPLRSYSRKSRPMQASLFAETLEVRG
jgi:hypothetical protein